MNASTVLRQTPGRRRLVAVAMLLALALQMLALVLSTGHWAAWLQVRAPGEQIVCTAAGLMRVLPSGELQALPDAPDAGLTSGGCPFCASAAQVAGPAPMLAQGVPLPLPGRALSLPVPAEARVALAPPHLLPPAQAPPARA